MKGVLPLDYKDTLLMPKTDFPMRGNLTKKEPEIQQKWEENRIYEKVQKRTSGRPKFVLHDGPPYANGSIHMGHALNKVIKDFIVRSRSMLGYDAPYVPGWDTHGLPIEQELTKKVLIEKKCQLLSFVSYVNSMHMNKLIFSGLVLKRLVCVVIGIILI